MLLNKGNNNNKNNNVIECTVLILEMIWETCWLSNSLEVGFILEIQLLICTRAAISEFTFSMVSPRHSLLPAQIYYQFFYGFLFSIELQKIVMKK